MCYRPLFSAWFDGSLGVYVWAPLMVTLAGHVSLASYFRGMTSERFAIPLSDMRLLLFPEDSVGIPAVHNSIPFLCLFIVYTVPGTRTSLATRTWSSMPLWPDDMDQGSESTG